MTRDQLEHIIRASASISEDDEIVIVGSQAILGQFPNAPALLLRSVEADVFPKNKVDRADLVDGSIGEGSPFHRTFGYYAQGVGPETSTLPSGWEQRLVPIRTPSTRDATGWCLDAHDLMIAKYVAGREKDREFTRCAAHHGLVQRDVLLKRLAATVVEPEIRLLVEEAIDRDFRGAI
jgi:hypothetical protein